MGIRERYSFVALLLMPPGPPVMPIGPPMMPPGPPMMPPGPPMMPPGPPLMPIGPPVLFPPPPMIMVPPQPPAILPYMACWTKEKCKKEVNIFSPKKQFLTKTNF
jgi:hypothetical protein